MLEHLHRDEAIFVLQECYRVLKKGGILRVAVPDLKIYVTEYINAENSFNNNDNPAADKFMNGIMLQGIGEVRPLFYKLMCKRHQWMYDFESLAKRLYDCGFGKVQECKLGEGLLPDVQELEKEYHKLHEPVSVFVEAIK
jgi:predicted SAM-dependent methyltransferase